MPSAPYDTVTNVINAARVRLNDKVDTLVAIGGKIIGNTQPFSQQMVNDGWRKLQEFLADLLYTGIEQETTFINVPAAGSIDPIIQASLGYNQYFDGVSAFPAIFLPQTLIRPYDLWERPNGSAQQMTEMDLVVRGLPKVPKSNWNRLWEWRDDVVYLPGALVATDIAMRYAQYFADFVDQGTTPWYSLSVPIMRCLDAFADFICREAVVARGDMDAAVAFQTSAQANAHLIVNRDTARPKAIAKASEYGRMQDRFTPNSGADTQPVKR